MRTAQDAALCIVPGALASDQPLVLRCPSDKSLTHRAVMFASMAKGRSEVLHPLLGADCLSTMATFRALGVRIDVTEQADGSSLVTIDSPGWDGWQSPSQDLDWGNSGTTARLLIGLFAATPGLNVRCIGDESLSQRPMLRVVKPLREIGAQIDGEGGGNFLPIKISGRKLRAGHHTVDKATAQVKSALCLAALNCDGETTVELPAGSRDHTEKFFRYLGAQLEVSQENGVERIKVSGPFRPHAFRASIPSDPSSAAFFAVLAALHPGLTLKLNDVLDNNTRCGFIAKLQAAGVNIATQTPDTREGAAVFVEPVKHLFVSAQELRGFTISPEDVPTLVDEVPILAVLAAFAKGRSRFTGLAELRVKESDRLLHTFNLLQAAGVEAVVEGDTLTIEGGRENVRAFTFDPQADHRLAMAAAVLATRADGKCFVKQPDCVKVSFPEFFSFLKMCGVSYGMI
jgi:3-phosphoshikimate 1-carboxyvinyltransferase